MRVKSESEVAQLCLTLHDPMDCSLAGSSVHGIFQVRVLEWGAIAFSSNYLDNNLKKIRDTKGTFHAKMGSIKDRNVLDLTEAEDIKKRWQEYTEELYKKDLYDPNNHNGVITHLEPDILECEALESITTKKASGGGGIPVGLFQILKDDAVKVLQSICQEIGKTQ